MNFSRIALALAASTAIALPASAETWKSIGTGLFRENFIHAIYAYSEYPEVEVEIEESEQTPGRYRIVNPYKNYPDFIGSPGCYEGDYYITIDASDPVHCYIETSRTGYQWGGQEMLIVGSIADDYYNTRYGDWELADKENRCGKLVDGAITFPKNALLAASWNPDTVWDDDILWLTCDNDLFRLKLPGAPDLDITAELDGINDAHTVLSFNIGLGSSVEKALIALVESESGDGLAEKIVSGEIPSIEVKQGGAIDLPYTGDGIFTLVVVPFCENKARTAFCKTLEIAYDESVWRKAGKALYREGVISSVDELIKYGFVYPAHEYYVDVEENVQKPGYIRLVDPYGDACPLGIGYSYDSTRHWYLYVDATDPGFVQIELSYGIGLNLGYGKMSIWSKANRLIDDNDPDYIDLWKKGGLTDDQIIEKAHELSGKFINDEITFPQKAISFSCPDVNPGIWYEANSKGEFSIKFQPGQINGKQWAAVENIEADDLNAPVVYYRLDGSVADSSDLTPGLYIVRKGSKSYKTVIR